MKWQNLVFRLTASPLPQSLGAFKLEAQFFTSSLTVAMSLAISGGHASMTSRTFFCIAMPSVHVIGMYALVCCSRLPATLRVLLYAFPVSGALALKHRKISSRVSS